MCSNIFLNATHVQVLIYSLIHNSIYSMFNSQIVAKQPPYNRCSDGLIHKSNSNKIVYESSVFIPTTDERQSLRCVYVCKPVIQPANNDGVCFSLFRCVWHNFEFSASSLKHGIPISFLKYMLLLLLKEA